MLLHEVIEFAALAAPGDVALVSNGRSWNFAELWRDVQAMAARLVGLAEVGERIAVVSDNCAEVLIAQYAAPMVGVVVMLANTRLTSHELIVLIADVEPVALLGAAGQLERLDDRRRLLPTVRTVVSFDALAAIEPASPEAVLTRREGRSEDEWAWIIHTSGTTGHAKGAILTHRSLLAAVLNTAMCRPTAPDEVYLFPFPLFHVAAYNVVHLHLRRRPVVLVAKFDAVAVMTAIETHRVSAISLAPTMIAMLLDHPERASFDLSSLRHVFYGASAIPRDVLVRAMDELGCDFGQGYGMTELSGNAVFLDGDAHRRGATSEPHLLGAAGLVGPLSAIRLVDDGGNDMGHGGSGEILVRGDQVIGQYFAEGRASAVPTDGEGWFRTGDIGRFDDAGHLYVTDRRKDIIVSGGENVASREVEDVVAQHPHVAQVAVVAAPHSRWGEQVVAVVVVSNPDADPDLIREWCRGRLAGFKRPRQVLIVDSLPLNASGKVLKADLRARVLELLGPPH